MKPRELAPKQTWIMHPFGTGLYKFHIGLAQCTELENFVGNGFAAIAGDVMVGRIAVGTKADANPFSHEATGSVGNPFRAIISVPLLRRILIQALIGGNYGLEDGLEVEVSPRRAQQLVDLYGPPERPVEESWDVAAALMYAIMVGIDPYAPPVAENSDGSE